MCFCTNQGVAETLTWDGSEAVSNWSVKKNWGNGNGQSVVSNDSLIFAGNTNTTNTNDITGLTGITITFASGAGAFTLNGNSITLGGAVTNSSTSLQTVNLPVILSATQTFNAASGDLALGGVISGTGGLTKTGANKLTLSGTNTYAGATTVSAGTLALGSAGTFANSTSIVVGSAGSSGTQLDLAAKSSFSFGSGQTLSGIGTVNIGADKTVTINGTHAVGNGGVGTQTVTGNLAYGSGSIFSWDVASATSYDKVVVSGTATGSGAFDIVNTVGGYATGFWDADKTWSGIFTTGSGDLASVFGSITGTGISWDGSKGVVAGQGSFSFSGNNLNWTAVPEPTSAFAGLLLSAGLLRRRRQRTA